MQVQSTDVNIGARMLQTRWLARSPIWLFRARLGFLFGRRLLLLEHRGRTTGQPRYVVLESVERTDPDTIVIASGFGPSAQWYQNLMAEPRCHVSIGARHRVPALARALDEDEASAVLTRYQREHPRAYRQLDAIIQDAVGARIATVPLVELSLQR